MNISAFTRFFRFGVLKKATLVSVWVVGALFGASNDNWLNPPGGAYRPAGFMPMSPQQMERLYGTWPKVMGVRPNKIGMARINQYLSAKGLAALNLTAAQTSFDEFIVQKPGEVLAGASALQSYTLPRYVDNSTLPSFPPIGDQGQEGSCTAFGTTYYQATHEVGLLNGRNNKASNLGILSPKWTYNMINFGEDGGSTPDTACALLAQNGAPSIASLPYVAGDYRSWDMNPQNWVDALVNRTTPPVYIPGLDDPKSQALTTIKQALNNGHVLTFATFVYSWVITNILNDPSPSADNRFVGQAAVSWMNGTYGGHYITIVGYNDDLWIDVNGNGQVDPGEKGAFLIANSWGNRWGNQGFIWISYDAFFAQSQVAGGPSFGRYPLGIALENLAVSITGKAANYKPQLYAQFTLSQTMRNQISISAGASSINQTMPAAEFPSGAIINSGGAYAFNGTRASTPQMGTFALDLTDLVDPTMATTGQRFWFVVNDNQIGNTTTVNSFTITDPINGNAMVNNSTVPVNCDNNRVELYVDYKPGQGPTPPTPPVPPQNDTTPPSVSIAYPQNGQVLGCVIPVAIIATDDKAVARVELYVDGQLVGTQTQAPYLIIYDSLSIINGNHTFTAVAYDTSNNKSSNSVTVYIHNCR